MCVCVSVCLLCAQDCKHGAPQGSDQICTVTWQGEGESLYIQAKEELQSQQKSLISLQWKVKVFFVQHCCRCMQARSFTWLLGLSYLIDVDDLSTCRASVSLAYSPMLPQASLSTVFQCSSLSPTADLNNMERVVFRVRLQINHLFHICTLLKALNRLITDIISKCHPL